MAGIFDRFRKQVFHSVWKDKDEQDTQQVNVDDKIALGVLLWVVADADDKFLPEEKDAMKRILAEYGNITQEDMPVVMESVGIAASERIDLYSFTQEVSQDLSREVKIDIVESLFRVACCDNDLAIQEEEMIRKISGLFRLDHKEFIGAKVKVKKEFGMDTAGL